MTWNARDDAEKRRASAKSAVLWLRDRRPPRREQVLERDTNLDKGE